MKNTFKVLVFAGQYVDESLLQKGIYFASKPILHDAEETIEAMKSKMDDFEKYISGFSAEKAKAYIGQCELRTVELTFI